MYAETPTWKERLNNFFYAEEVPYGMALVRIGLPIVMLCMVAPRWIVTREIFSADGAPAQLSVGYGYGNLMPEFSAPVAVALNSLLVLAMVTSMIGFRTRLSLWITFVLYTYFSVLDSISTTTKYTVLSSHMFLILAVSPCGAVWSVDAWLANYRRQKWPGEPSIVRPKYPVWSRRLMQFLIGICYFGASVTKMQTPGFFSSDQLQSWMLTHINYRHPIGEYFSLYPELLVAFAYIIIVWEVLFVFLTWNRAIRPFMLAIGVLFHFMTTLTLGLLLFPATCYCAYLAFADEEDFVQLSATFRRYCRQFSWLKAATNSVVSVLESLHPQGWGRYANVAFAVVCLTVMVGGAAVEHQIDPYGERRPDGPYTLIEVEPEIIREMLSPTPPLRDVDKFFAVDTGTFQFGDLLVDRRTSYRQGERMIAQCHMTMPHEDMWIEMQLLDGDSMLVARKEAVATREMYRAHFQYDFTDTTPPGEYTLVIRTAGHDIMRRPLTILPSHRSAAAN